MPKPSYTRIAGGNIVPATFVKIDTATGRAVTCGAGEDIFGIAQAWTRRPPLTGLDDGFAAIAGEGLEIYGPGDDGAQLALGGTVLPGQRIKSDASGKGVAATSDKDKAGAIANHGGVSGELIGVKPQRIDIAV